MALPKTVSRELQSTSILFNIYIDHELRELREVVVTQAHADATSVAPYHVS